MCGIAGFYNKSRMDASEDVIKKMYVSLVHRGPDDNGCYIDGPIALGHTRLSIVDLSPLGHQPMFNEDGSVVVVYNGEIYNHLIIRAELEKKGHKFISRTDTEMLLHAYEEWGFDCLEKFIGMFAFGIWDRNKKRIFLARDRLGIKPLLYADLDDVFIFASELKCILQHPSVKSELNVEALYHYISFYVVPQPWTMIKGVKSLEPGNFLVFECNDQGEKTELTRKRYWRMQFGDCEKGMTEAEACDGILRHLKKSIELRQMSDVPIGAFLSGGTDSSTVVALMSQIVREPVRTFSIGFKSEGKALDELPYARQVAEKFKCRHTEFVITCDQVKEELPEIIWYFDEPAGFAMCNYFVAKIARQGDIVVALSGLGGDELFGGYERYTSVLRREKIFKKYRILPVFLREKILEMSRTGRMSAFFPERVKGFLKQAELDFSKRYRLMKAVMTEAEKRNLFQTRIDIDGFDSGIICENLFNEVKNEDILHKIIYCDLNTYLSNDLLRHMDTMTMAHSLEARVPLMDHNFVEFSSKIPANMKIKNGSLKYILKKAVKNIVPEEVLYRKKMGFNFPTHIWMRTGLKETVEKTLSKESIEKRGLFNFEEVEKIKYSFYRSSVDSMKWWIPHMKLWSLVVFELWARLYLDSSKPQKPDIPLNELLNI